MKNGRPCINGKRITVAFVVAQVRQEIPKEQIISEYDLTSDEIDMAMEYYREHYNEKDKQRYEELHHADQFFDALPPAYVWGNYDDYPEEQYDMTDWANRVQSQINCLPWNDIDIWEGINIKVYEDAHGELNFEHDKLWGFYHDPKPYMIRMMYTPEPDKEIAVRVITEIICEYFPERKETMNDSYRDVPLPERW